jgi:hypothetical protein
MKILNQNEIEVVAGTKCFCKCRQIHTESYNQTNWNFLNGKKYETILLGYARDIGECLKVCHNMMEGNLFESCLTIKQKSEGWGKDPKLIVRESGRLSEL